MLIVELTCMVLVCLGAMVVSWFLENTNLRGLCNLGHDGTDGNRGKISGMTDRPNVHDVFECRGTEVVLKVSFDG